MLTENLLPLLSKSATPGHASRVVHVASLGQSAIDFDDLMLVRGYSGTRAYGRSKVALIMHGLDLAASHDPAGLTAISLHPGTHMPTKMVLSEIGTSSDSIDTGVRATRRLVLDPALEGVTGQFFDRDRPTRASSQAYDRRARETLRARTLELVEQHLAS